MTTLSRIKVLFPRTLFTVKPKSSRDHDSKICVMTGPLVSLAKPLPFLQSSRLRLGCGLARCSSASSCGAFVVVGGVGERRQGRGVGERRQGGGVGEHRAAAALSSSHVDVARSSSRRLLGLGVGAGRVRGGNSMVRY